MSRIEIEHIKKKCSLGKGYRQVNRKLLYRCFMYKFFKYNFLVIVMLVVCGCAFPRVGEMTYRPENDSRIGVVSLLGNNALVRTEIGNIGNTTIPLRNFDYDRYVVSNVVQILKSHGYSNTSAISFSSQNPVGMAEESCWQDPSLRCSFLKEGIDYIKQITQPGEYDIVIAILPESLFDVKSGYCGYGVVFSNSPSNQGEICNKFFLGVNILFLNGENYKILTSGLSGPSTLSNSVCHKQSYNGSLTSSVPSAELKEWLKYENAHIISRSVQNGFGEDYGLPGPEKFSRR
jgi:hypothetical protein